MDISAMIVALATSMTAPMWQLLFAFGGLTGFLYFGGAVSKVARATRFPGEPPVTIGDVLGVLFVAAMMANLSTVINRAWNSMGAGVITYGPITYSNAASLGVFAVAINAVLTLVSISGGYFFFKGLLFLKRAVSGHSSHGADDFVWRAVTHMFGGAALVQITNMIDALDQSLGNAW